MKKTTKAVSFGGVQTIKTVSSSNKKTVSTASSSYLRSNDDKTRDSDTPFTHEAKKETKKKTPAPSQYAHILSERKSGKSAMVQNAKTALDRERCEIVTLNDILKKEEKAVVIDKKMLQGRRVVVIRNCNGPGTIILPEILSMISMAKGIIKIFIVECDNCTIQIECKIITSMIEISHCSNVTLEMKKERISTVQADLCEGLTLKYMDERCFGRKEDKIYHAGVRNMNVLVFKNGGEGVKMEKSMDFIRDGAIPQMDATAEEYQFVTYVADGHLSTEPLLRFKSYPMTQSELNIKKGENCLSNVTASNPEDIIDVINQCIQNKLDGDEAFTGGMYTQAVLFYSKAIEKGVGLGIGTTDKNKFEEIHICFAKRSACYLKLGHHEKAFADADSCTKMDPLYVKGKFQKGLVLYAMGRHEEAMPVLIECNKLESKNKLIEEAIHFCEVNIKKKSQDE